MKVVRIQIFPKKKQKRTHIHIGQEDLNVPEHYLRDRQEEEVEDEPDLL